MLDAQPAPRLSQEEERIIEKENCEKHTNSRLPGSRGEGSVGSPSSDSHANALFTIGKNQPVRQGMPLPMGCIPRVSIIGCLEGIGIVSNAHDLPNHEGSFPIQNCSNRRSRFKRPNAQFRPRRTTLIKLKER